MPPGYRPSSPWPGVRTLNLLALLALLGAACQRQAHVPAPILSVASSPMEEAEHAFRQGAYVEAERLYWNLLDPETPAERERALFRLALVHALPDSPLRDHDRSRKYLDLLEEDFPATEFAGDVIWIHGVLDELEELSERETESAAERERLTAEAARLQREREALESALAQVLPLPAGSPEEAEAGGAGPNAEAAGNSTAENAEGQEPINELNDLEELWERLQTQYPNAEVVARLATVPALRARVEALAQTQQEQLAEIRNLTVRLAALNAELERLKEIDLRRRPQD